ncbi:MAB_1171c family putative transporter [Kitasatospora sp. NPDC094015]|uniref:MAB_1171c family putative transporter n=1 Tax=Kitasatospora sp. NPDC094015 TaxID=3155205 RepID=UPI0033182E66
MIDLAAVAACLAALGGIGFRLHQVRGSRLRSGTWYLLAFALCMALATAALAPAVAGVARSSRSWALALALAGGELKLAGGGFLALLALSVEPPGRSRRLIARQSAGTLAVIAVSSGCFLASGAVPDTGELYVPGSGRAPITAYNGLFTAHSTWCLTVFLVLVGRASRQVEDRLLLAGLRLVLAGAVVGLIWSVLSIGPLLDALTTGHQLTREDHVSATASVLALGLGLGGATLTSWAGPTGRPLRWLRAWYRYRKLAPLWAALRSAVPGIAFDAAGPAQGGRLPRDAEFALYRRVIEIRDGQLALRPYLHPEAAGWAAAEAARRERADPRRLAATVEAAVLALAIEAATAGRPRSAAPAGYVPPQMPADPDVEAAWLCRVATAFTCSGTVRRLRERARTEPGP